ncbi:MAG: PAS domain-containing sensor histidine kinase [Deltaproteobacteria bacterium]|nr:MAG: PAS domain-containing sensor histidine kinase [Deltaproteobacteria bacterium]
MVVDRKPHSPTPPPLEPADVWQLLEKLGIGVLRIDHRTGALADANEALVKMYGFRSREEAHGRPVLSAYADPAERAEAAARILNHPGMRRDGFVRIEAERRRIDNGAPIDVLMSIVPTLDERGEAAVLDVLMEDIGERKQAQKAFRTGSERFRLLFDASPVGTAITTPPGQLTRVNAALAAFLGEDEEALRSQMLMDLVHPSQRAEAEAAFAVPADASAHGLAAMTGLEWRFRDNGEAPRWGRVSWSWLVDGGEAHSRVVIVEDISHRKEMEQVLLRAEKMEAIGLLAGGIAHDFNNFLTGILGSMALARSAPDATPAIRELLDLGESAARRARDLTQQLITFSKGGSPVKRAVSIVDIARETADFCLCGTSAELALSAESDLDDSIVDPGQMSQVFQNLLLNAAEAMPDGGVIRVAARNAAEHELRRTPLPPGRYVRVDVSDQGVGIAPHHVQRVFDAYFSTKQRGSGLGLTTVLSIVQRHGGHVELRSRVGEGTTVSLFVPASESRHEPTPAQRSASSEHAFADRRALVMDDDAIVRRVAGSMLAQLGFDVVTVEHGAAAIAAYDEALAAGAPFSLVILDLTVKGGMGGLATLYRLRALDPAVRAIVSSGYSTDPVMADHRAHGFAGVMPKPFTQVQLQEAVLAALEGGDVVP